jgi:hypothetical protein
MNYVVDVNRTNDVQVEADNYDVGQDGVLNFFVTDDAGVFARTVASFAPMNWIYVMEATDVE